MERREFMKRTAAAAILAAAPRCLVSNASAVAPVSPVALRRCTHYQRAAVYDTLGQMFSDLGGLGSLVNGKRVALKTNGVSYGNFNHGQHCNLAQSTHPEVVYAVCRHLLQAGAASINIMDSFNTTNGTDTVFDALGFNRPEFLALGTGSQVRFYSTRNKEMDVTNPDTGFAAYARLNVPDPYMFNYFYVNKLWATPKADIVVSVGKMKSHDVAGVSLGIKNVFGCLPNSIYGGDIKTVPDEAETKARGNACHNAVWIPVGERSGHGIAVFDSERMPRLLADLCRALPIHLSVVDGITGNQVEMSPKPYTSIVTPGVLAAGFNPVCVDAVCTGVMGGDPKAAPGTSLFPSGQNHIALAAAKGVGSNDLSLIPVLGDPISKVRYHFYPAMCRAANNPAL